MFFNCNRIYVKEKNTNIHLFPSSSLKDNLQIFISSLLAAESSATSGNFNKLEPHSTHDVVLSILVFDCELLVTNSQRVPPEYK